MRTHSVYIYIFLLLCLGGCGEPPLPRGVVALVNGMPIYLRSVETLHDTRTTNLGTFEKLSIHSLQQQYGEALTTLITQTLILQELERVGTPITDAMLEEEESRIRQDYPEDEFEKHLTENAIDLAAWRDLTRLRLGFAHFLHVWLRTKITIELEEIEQYYRANEDDFALPRMLHIYQIQSPDKQLLDDIRAQGALPAPNEAIRAYPLALCYDSVPPEWQASVYTLKNGEFTQPLAKDGLYEMLWLVQDMPARRLDLVDAYPHIEQILLEEKVDAALQQWIEHTLPKARIRVSHHLLPGIMTDKNTVKQ